MIIALVLACFLLLLLGLAVGAVALVSYAASRPHTKKLWHHQAQINAKLNISTPATQTLATGTPMTSGTSSSDKKERKWFRWALALNLDQLWSLMLCFLVLFLIVSAASDTQGSSEPRFSEVGNWARLHFWHIVVISISLLILIKKHGGKLEGSFRFATYVILILFGVAGCWYWWSSKPLSVERQAYAIFPSSPNCPNITFREVRSCWIDGNWTNMIKSDDGSASTGMHPCFSHADFVQAEDEGQSYIQFKSAVGKRELLKYRLFPPPDYVCPDGDLR